jgi:hypothetical protein
MMIIGCDFHPSWQQVSWLDETGDCGERKLVHASGDAKVFYQQLALPVLIGMEATGNSKWFVELVEDMGHEIWIGDAAQIRASYVRKQKTDKRDAAHILKLVVQGRFPRLWTPDREQRDLRQLVLHRHKLVEIRSRVKNELQHLSMNKGMQRKAKLVEPGWAEDVARVAVKTVGGVPSGRFAGIAFDVEPAGRPTRRCGATGSGGEPAGPVADDAAGSRSKHGAGPCAHHRRCGPLWARQASGELFGTDTARGKFGRTAEAGSDHQTRQPHAALAAGGSGADGSATRSRPV